METALQSPSIESFSYSWLANLKPIEQDSSTPSIDAFDHHDEASFIEMDPRLPPSKRFFKVNSSDFCLEFDFDFDFPVSESQLDIVHADELISNGFLVPCYVKDKKMDDIDQKNYYISSTSVSSSHHQELCLSLSRVRYGLLKKCQRLSKCFFQKYLVFLFRSLFCKRGGNSKKNMRRVSDAISPRSSVGYSVDENWRMSCDSESSIIEAVLHCKRTCGN